ncbi:MAG: alkaline phosphatase family protein [Winkia neuii]|nr:nucleotide pyrophosphatase/phosphodiesterase family protein [Winkia neuii]OFJ70138.1 hypothetical protein HMPREF2851_10360 [Actinomyces sp. HMSC064C12]OFK04456.1 hypothetical protein HMPREF2835_04330 [Actinomyces sp. HMSC072A03]OFT56294.1 hypothetical protein HMPREF3152_01925 [Actinomyces sp. HMSC06A08]MDK8099892.1 alkaline phosphatase family protein [Winkia neuii]MDU3134903.1 alkaline phosphatase family protein [Winkia neuii]
MTISTSVQGAAWTGMPPRRRIYQIFPALMESLQASDNWLLPGCQQVLVFLVDGLGKLQLDRYRAHARRLASLEQIEGVQTCVPSTTAAAITSFATGLLPGQTRMVGYEVAGRNWRENLITFANGTRAEKWQDQPTCFEVLAEREKRAAFVGKPKFDNSGLTRAALRGSQFIGARSLSETAAEALKALEDGFDFVYMYWSELDHAGHSHGVGSEQWIGQLEEVDGAISQLRDGLPQGAALVVTADHGMVNTDEEHVFEVGADSLEGVYAVGGEPRALHLHCENAAEVARRWQRMVGERALVTLAKDSPLGAVRDQAAGQVQVWMRGRWVCYVEGVHSAGARSLVGVHGSLTEAEMSIPLLRTY